ncbi:MAG: ATP-binding cassette domain-containing protein, partial [Acidimicrobiales bacterium]
STLLRAISGLTTPKAGTIHFDGQDISSSGPGRAAALGISQAPGGKGVFPGLSVAENLRMATWLYRRQAQEADRAVNEVLERFPALRARLGEPGANLSGGEQQMLTLGQAFIARPRLLLIDELSLGLAPAVVEPLLDMVRSIRARGVTIVIVEQSVNIALTICDRALFMEKGQVRYEGPAAELLDRPDLLRAVFLGSGPAPAEHDRAAGPVVIEVRDLAKRYGGIRAVDGVSFDVHQGEIVGMIGANGAGKTTVFDLISGHLQPDEGTVVLDGTDVSNWAAHRRAAARLGRSAQDARLFPSLTVAETIAVACERHMAVRDPLATVLAAPDANAAERAVAARVEELVELLGLAAHVDSFIAELSTGTRRIVELACCLAHEPKVLLLDEPSAGIAQREAEALGPLLRRIHADTGASLVVIDHDIALLRSIADRLIALEVGRIIANGPTADVLATPRVIASYLGGDPAATSRSGPSRRSIRRTRLV